MSANSGQKRKRNSSVSLPLAKVTVIMRSSPDVGPISGDAVLLTAKAAELYVSHLASTALQTSGNKKKLDYKQIADVVNNDESFAFLKDVIPKPITAQSYRKVMRRVKRKEAELGRYLIQKELDEVRRQDDDDPDDGVHDVDDSDDSE